jgi:rare lipoprotein A
MKDRISLIIIVAIILSMVFLTGCPPRAGYYVKDDDGGFDKRYTEVGLASYYGSDFHGKPTASGETYDMWEYTCAHRELPFGTYLLVTNLENGRKVTVRVNDRGPFVEGRIIDLSYNSARALGMLEEGVVEVKIEVLR